MLVNAFVRKRNKNFIVYLEYPDNLGKRKQKNMGSFSKKRDANKKLNEIKEKIYNKDFSIINEIENSKKDRALYTNNITFGEFVLDFLEGHKKNICISTYDSYSRICKNHITRHLGEYKLSELTAMHIQEYIDLLSDNLNPKTIRVHINILKLVLKRAYKLKLIKENIIDDIDIPRAKKYKNNIYDKEQMLSLIESCNNVNIEMKIAINLALGLGFRLSEILGITWDNVDFEENTIFIDKITSRTKGKVLLKEPKTESSTRMISAPTEIMDLLKEFKLKQMKDALKKGSIKNKHNLVFFDKEGKPIAEDVISKKFTRFLKNNNLPHIRFHDLRHSHVTLLIMSKIPINVISQRVGHADISTTLNIYSHVLKEMDKGASDKIAKVLYKAN
ncbi:tyrosine-type recombinase/integrase [Clostridioides sp. ZZV15-6597]|uniref:tyrosine-type recombinase/integrase n=1 Tax=Clostridioides sp. ZZV15-6597 TaxID=2811500 RepID=UPI001D10FEAA|nr:tyrosine-type recombinase/integrase [Clostridioides sp. ZZV15-6597]